eukprot:3889743-Prorocentrum_lima.AAC.1
MTSSLVGSEMCIRDRKWANMSMSFLGLPKNWQHQEDLAKATQTTAPTTCLLYTSDAADDM